MVKALVTKSSRGHMVDGELWLALVPVIHWVPVVGGLCGYQGQQNNSPSEIRRQSGSTQLVASGESDTSGVF